MESFCISNFIGKNKLFHYVVIEMYYTFEGSVGSIFVYIATVTFTLLTVKKVLFATAFRLFAAFIDLPFWLILSVVYL